MVSTIIDGNFLAHKTFSIFSNYGAKQPGDVLGNQTDCDTFMRKMITDMCYFLNQLPDTGHVIFVKDSKSWRKELKIDRVDYKGDRKHAEKVNWGNFFDLIEELGVFLSENGYIYSHVNRTEGDDLLWFWNRELRELGHDVVIYSGDRDSHQMVETKDGHWTVCWNGNSKNNKLFCSKDWEESYLNGEEDEMSIFDMDFSFTGEKDKMKKLAASCTVEIVNVEKLIFEKILTGDKGDSVPAVFAYQKADNKVYKVTEKKAESIYNSYKLSPWYNKDFNEIWNDDDFNDWIAGYVLRSMDYIDNKENRKIVMQNYKENAQLVWLSSEVIPKDIIEDMNESYNSLDLEIRSILTDKKLLIEKSKWSKIEAPSMYNPFKDFL